MAGFDDFAVGDAIPECQSAPITGDQLAAFAAASGDRNPIHLDDAAAKQSGLPGVIAHGMLNMATLGRLVTGFVAPTALRGFSTRFVAMAFPGDILTCRGAVTAKRQTGGENLLDLKIEAVNQAGERILDSQATVAVR